MNGVVDLQSCHFATAIQNLANRDNITFMVLDNNPTHRRIIVVIEQHNLFVDHIEADDTLLPRVEMRAIVEMHSARCIAAALDIHTFDIVDRLVEAMQQIGAK